MSKGIMYIDDQRVEFDGEKNVLAVIRKAGIDMPTFCYYSELSTYGACRMCVVENEWGGIDASCSMQPKDGMRIKTNTLKLRKHRKMILELLLAAHCRDCTTCDKNGKCKLQELAKQFGITRVRFNDTREEMEPDNSSPAIVRNPNKCILCGDCVRVCSEIQGMGVLDFAFRGSRLQVMPAFNRKMSETNCISCGQCAAVCPTGAITIKKDIDKVWEAIYDKKKRVIVQIAPAVRVALGEEFGLPAGENVLGKLVAALKMVGFDHVYDTTLGADLTVMEESKEFLKRLENGGPFPMFTSCCPAWVKFMEQYYPEHLSWLSTTKSPQQVMGALIKSYFAPSYGINPAGIFSVSVMPCLAKKIEARREEMTTKGVSDVDTVISTRELVQLVELYGIDVQNVESQQPDSPFDIRSSAGKLFGVSGGSSEALARTLHYMNTDTELDNFKIAELRSSSGIREFKLTTGKQEFVFVVLSGMKSIHSFMAELINGNVRADYVEVMACPGGCVNGGGQPFAMDPKEIRQRTKSIYELDEADVVKSSHKNPVVKSVYDDFLKEPCGELAQKFLHTSYYKRDVLL